MWHLTLEENYLERFVYTCILLLLHLIDLFIPSVLRSWFSSPLSNTTTITFTHGQFIRVPSLSLMLLSSAESCGPSHDTFFLGFLYRFISLFISVHLTSYTYLFSISFGLKSYVSLFFP